MSTEGKRFMDEDDDDDTVAVEADEELRNMGLCEHGFPEGECDHCVPDKDDDYVLYQL
ncbi:MAG: hypothetical protein US74_C0012G0014 [Parcubacteria group bacterium GW2011_GWA2_38_13]|nr:MAG: hypothetical protein US74_C0012G0014 [Parcubacteria group bacterium GW2011_GWA2_38_13]